MRNKNILLLILISWLFAVNSQGQDFRITKFEENTLDLSAARSAVKDRNNDICALIKVAVRDTKFEYEPNMGVVKQERKVGEVWLYVPAGTKRMTIRHPQLGILRDYVIPVSIEQKVVYQMSLEITNKEYLQSMLHKAKADTVRIEITKDSIIYKENERKLFFNLGVGFNVVSIMAPSVNLGFTGKKHLIEAGAIFGLNKVKGVSIYQTMNSAYWGTYDYNAMRFYLRYGYDIKFSSFLVTPQVGVALNNIKGKEVRHGTGADLFSKTNTVSATVGCRFTYCISKLIQVQVTPEYDIGIKKDQAFNIIKEADSNLKSWTSGFNLNAGLIFQF